MGNSWPSRCRAFNSSRLFKIVGVPVATNRLRLCVCFSFSSAGIIKSARRFPSASARVQPNASSADRFHSVTAPFSSRLTKASLAVSITFSNLARTSSTLALLFMKFQINAEILRVIIMEPMKKIAGSHVRPYAVK